jgi:hypothetical protein
LEDVMVDVTVGGRSPMETVVDSPVDVVDHLLWRDAQTMLGRHGSPGVDGRCTWCAERWPCPPRRLAERAEVAARRPWRESGPAWHELNGRHLPSMREDAGSAVHGWPAANRGVFD